MNDIENELMHYGILGMHWGHRKGSNAISTRAKKTGLYALNKVTHPVLTNAATRNSISKDKMGTVVRRSMLYQTNKELDDINKDVHTMVNQKYKAKQDRKRKLDKLEKEINKKTPMVDKLRYNEATRRQAAKYMLDNNMTIEQANRKASNTAKRNTAILIGAYGASAYMMLKK